MDPVRLKALDKAIEAGVGYDPDGSLLVKKAKALETYLRGDVEDERDEPTAGERVRLPNDYAKRAAELFSDANADMYMAEFNAVLADLEWVESPTHAAAMAEKVAKIFDAHPNDEVITQDILDDYIARVTGTQSAQSATPDEIAAYNERMREAADHSKGEV